MVSFDKLALFASFLQRVRSISLGPNLRAFILRCLLLWPRILRYVRNVWSWHFQTSFSDEKKPKRHTRGPYSTETLRKREGCVVVCASRDLGGGGEPSRHSILGSNDAEQSIPLKDIPRTPSVPHSLSSSHAPSPQGSPRLSATRLTSGSPYGSTSSLRTGNPHGAMEFIIRRSNTPVSWTHPRATSRQFIGSSSLSHSRPSSPFRLLISRPSTPAKHDSDDIEKRQETQAPVQQSQGSLEGSTSEVSIQLELPSRSASPEDTESMSSFSRPQIPLVHGSTQSLPTHHQLPSSDSVNSSVVSSHSGRTPSTYGVYTGAHQSRGSNQDSVPSQSIQPPRIPFPQPSLPHISTQISTTNAPNAPPRLDTLPVRPMHTEQVSRYMKKGDV